MEEGAGVLRNRRPIEPVTVSPGASAAMRSPPAPSSVSKGEKGMSRTAGDDEDTSSAPLPLSATSPLKDGADWFESHPSLSAWIVFLVAFVSRFYRLDEPRGVVFDEVRSTA